MKRLFLFFIITLLCSCSKEAGFYGKSYQLLNAMNDINVIIEFDKTENRYSGKIVNNHFGTFEIDGKNIKFNPIGNTMMMGPPEAMEAEQNFLDILPRIISYKMVGSNLVLVTNNGQELGFEEISKTNSQL